MANQTRVGGARAKGGFYSAATKTALPTDAQTPLDSGFKLVSLVSDDGLKEALDRKSDDIRAWDGSIARTVQSEYSETWKLTLIERTDESLKEIYGQDNVTSAKVDGGTLRTIQHTEDQLPIRAYVADMQDGPVMMRKVFPEAQITDIGDIKYVKKDVISYEITLTAYKDENARFSYDYEFIPDEKAAA
ncbi:hypothetical protein AB0O80_10595 [Rothia kristinae]|uniref:phage tail tube protein n=1 Tax=Actinomycetes TaxID=1760 RepID=UPI00342D6F51